MVEGEERARDHHPLTYLWVEYPHLRLRGGYSILPTTFHISELTTNISFHKLLPITTKLESKVKAKQEEKLGRGGEGGHR